MVFGVLRESKETTIYLALTLGASLLAQLVKNLPAMQKTWVLSLGWEETLEKGKSTHFSILAWRIPWVEKSWTRLSDFHFHLKIY